MEKPENLKSEASTDDIKDKEIVSNEASKTAGEPDVTRENPNVSADVEYDTIALDNGKAKEKKKPIAVFFAFLADVLSIMMIMLCVIIFYSAITNHGKNGTAVGPFMMFNVLTGSMHPAINPGSLIITKAVDKDELAIGDIVTFMPSEDFETLVTHRIVSNGEDPDFFVTRGDSNNVNDDPVHYKNIVGKVIFWIPLLGLVISSAASPVGCALVIAIFVLFIILVEVIKKLIKG